MSSPDTVSKTFTVATLLCLVCSIVVSTAAVVLKPIQKENQLLDRNTNILSAAGLMQEGKSVEEIFAQLETKIVDLDSGEFAENIDQELYDQRKAAKDPNTSQRLAADIDIASIKRRADYATVYLKRDPQGNLQTIILPIHGYGLWSTLYGFLALEADANTVVGLGFYEHAETPGLGGEVDNPKWKALWPGKRLYDENFEPNFRVLKGRVDPNKPGAEYQIDGLAGATLTSRGVDNLIRFWSGDHGFGPFLKQIRAQES